MAATVNRVWYVNYGNGTTTGYYALAQWATGTSYTVGQIVRQKVAPSVTNERCFICIVAGTSHATTEPTWTITKGGKTTDNTVTWQECTGQAAVNGDATNVPLSSGQRSQSVVLGSIIQNNGGTFLFICSTAGTAGAGEPTYNTTTGNTTTDSGVTWTCIGAPGANGTGSFGKWAAPSARFYVVTPGNTSWGQQGDTFYLSSIHAETQSSGSAQASLGFGSSASFSKACCVSQTGNIPPQSADVTTGATITFSGTFVTIGLTGVGYVQGITWASTGAGNTPTFSANGLSSLYLKNGAINGSGASNAQSPTFGSSTGGVTKTVLDNVNIQVASIAGNSILISGNFIWKDSTLTKNTGGVWPTTLFSGGGFSPNVYIESVDLSAYAGTQFFGSGEQCGHWTFNKCKLPSSLTVFTQANATGFYTGFTADIIDCDSGGNTYRHERWNYLGSHIISTPAVRTGGTSNGTTSFSWKIVTTANAQWVVPFETLPLAIWNTTTGANVVVTLHGLYNGSALPNNDDIWMEAEYFGTSSSTSGSRKNNTKSDLLASGSATSADTGAAWNSTATVRQNSHAYVLDDLMTEGTAAAGQLYICTTAGTSAGTVPGGYASCSDGSTVTDGTAVFRALMRFTMAVTLTSPQPQIAGYLNIYPKVGKASGTFFLDPLPVLS